MRRIFLYIAALLILPSTLLAQWKEVAHNLLSPFRTGYGAIYYTDGMIWTGNSKLYASPDTGKTWTLLPFTGGSQIRDIHFLDKHNGLVASVEGGVYLTRDGGETWKQIMDGEAWEVSFNGSPDIIHALTTAPAIFFTSFDGGATWSYKSLGTYGMSFAIARDGRIHAFSGERYQSSSRGWVNSSSDFGATWSNNGGIVDGDSYTLAVDSCDPRRVYLVNEDYASTVDGLSQFYHSTNAGITWIPGFADTGLFFNGSLATRRNVMYIGTVKGTGMYRSTDRGATWQLSGGPLIGYDSRSIFPVNDNLVLALDYSGSVWVTFNGGGDSLTTVSPVDTIWHALSLPEARASIQPLDTAQVGIRVRFPSGSGVNKIVPNEITYTLNFNPTVLGILQTDLAKSVIPPIGWVFTKGQVDGGSVTVTLTNTAGASLQFEQDFGKIVFTALATPSKQTTVGIELLSINAACNEKIVSFGVEGGLLTNIVVVTKHVSGFGSGEPNVVVFPNPVINSVIIQSSIDIGRATVAIYDQLGKKHSDKVMVLLESGSDPIDVSGLPNGTYYLRIEGISFKATKRIVINK